ncbi:MAG: YbjN domain-containing protein [Pseudomonadales bacterium]
MDQLGKTRLAYHLALASAFASAMWLLAAPAVSLAGSAGDGRQAASAAAQIAGLLQRSGHDYEQVQRQLWTVRLPGHIHEEVRINVVAHENLLILFTLLARAGSWEPTPDLLLRLLQLNAAYDRVKLGVDEHGGIFLRTDLSIRVIDDTEFRLNIEQLAAAADEIYAELSARLDHSQTDQEHAP